MLLLSSKDISVCIKDALNPVVPMPLVVLNSLKWLPL